MFYKKVVMPAAAAIFLIVLTAGCSKKLGYGVVNWSIPERNLSAGDIIPVYVKSNIGKVYIAAADDKTKIRFEVPLWQLSFFESKKEALSFQKKIEDCRFQYASVKLDGLPLRQHPDNSSKQIYRLRENQIIKILCIGEGIPVLRKGNPLPGAWYEVMTNDGSMGWCFSYNLTIYDERSSLTVAEQQEVKTENTDDFLQKALEQFWFPESYRKMIRRGQVDLEQIAPSYGFFPGTKSNIARVELKDISLKFPYSKITKNGERYKFEDSTLSFRDVGNNTIEVEFTDETGKPLLEKFVTMKDSAEDIINREEKRRANEIAKIAGSFSSSNYGSLKILEDGSFLWSGYKAISKTIISKDAGISGKVFIKYFIPQKLASGYDGILSFQFINSSALVNFMYKASSTGLRLEYVDNASFSGNILDRKSLNPVILFFSPDGNQ